MPAVFKINITTNQVNWLLRPAFQSATPFQTIVQTIRRRNHQEDHKAVDVEEVIF